jgi:hypothetical protein
VDEVAGEPIDPTLVRRANSHRTLARHYDEISALLEDGDTMAERLAMETVGAGAPPIRLIGEHVVPAGMQLDGTIIGGLSGIEYDDRSDRFLLVSDDRSKVNPARFYTAKITLSADGIDEVAFESVTFFRRPDGQTYPSIDEWAQVQDRYSAAEAALLGPVDPEELRLDPLTGNLAWSNEGIPAVSTTGSPVLIDPALRFSAPDGSFLRDLPRPEGFGYSDPAGPRPDHGIESLTFACNGEYIVSALEDPLKADGPEPTFGAGGLTRITVQATDGSVVAQYAYELDPLPDPADPSSVVPLEVWGVGNTGIASLVALDASTSTRFLILERAFVSGFGNRVRIYQVDVTAATDVRSVPSLAPGAVQPAHKMLLVDLAEVGLSQVQNSEGMTWGPDLPTGERTLLLVSDDNFSMNDDNVTQIVALAVSRQ